MNRHQPANLQPYPFDLADPENKSNYLAERSLIKLDSEVYPLAINFMAENYRRLTKIYFAGSWA